MVFVSYAREDAERAHALVTAIEKQGQWKCWWDHQLMAGTSYAKEIEVRLKNADCVVVLWSKASVQSDFVQDEARVGRDRKVLVPLLLDDAEPPLGFRSQHVRTLTDWSSDGPKETDDVLRDIARILGVPAPQARPAPPVTNRFVALALALAAITSVGVVAWTTRNREPREPEIVLTAVPLPEIPPSRSVPPPPPSPTNSEGPAPSQTTRPSGPKLPGSKPTATTPPTTTAPALGPEDQQRLTALRKDLSGLQQEKRECESFDPPIDGPCLERVNRMIANVERQISNLDPR